MDGSENMKRIALAILPIFCISILPATSAYADKDGTKIKCRPTRASAEAPMKVTPPTAVLKRGPRLITITTNCGTIAIQPYYKEAPVTLTILTTLMKAGYYNKTLCHRLTTSPIYVLQCGDPTLTGAGNPTGWKGYKDENLPTNSNNNYPEGIVAMANSGPGTNGSQMFFVYQNTTLGPNYTIWGKITKGLDIVKYVAAQKATSKGSDGKWYYATDGYPLQPVKIISAIVS